MNKYVLSVVGIGLVSVALFFGTSFIQKKSLKDAIAQAVNADSSSIVLNIPPKPYRVPGTILSPKSTGFLLYAQGDMEHENIVSGETFSIEANIQDLSSVKSGIDSSIFKNVLNNSDHLNVSVNISDAKVVELPVPALKEIATNDSSTDQALKNGHDPVIINRAYVGKVEYVVKAEDQLGIDTLLKMSDKSLEISERRGVDFSFADRIESKKEISFSIAKPIIFAYELMSMKKVTTELSDEAFDLNLTPISARRAGQLIDASASSDSAQPNQPPKWGLITISSAHYSLDAGLNVPEAAEGERLVNELFSKYNPTFVKNLRSTQSQPLSDERILEFSIDLTMELLTNPVDHLLVYYTGHGLSLPNGEMLLLQGNVQKDYAEKSLDAIDPQIASENDGLLTVSTLHNALGTGGVPFTLIIDACYPNDEMQNALTHVHMQMGSRDGSGLEYFGNEALITDELAQIGRAMRNIGGRFPYRTAQDAVIFSSKPGARSVFRENPVDSYGFKVPPLASRLLRMSVYAEAVKSDQNLANLIRPTIDSVGGLGEIGLDGSITWSDIDNMMSFFKEVHVQQ